MQISIVNSISEIERVHQWFHQLSEGQIDNLELIRKMNVVIDEVLTNIINHGTARSIDVDCQVGNESIKLVFKDKGSRFDPLSHDSTPVIKSLENQQEGGLGIHLIKSFADEVNYARKGDTNVLVIRKFVH